MTSNFSGFEPDSIPNNSEFDNLESDCFELLSAYIDGELSPTEKQQVQIWLDEEPKVKDLYLKLLNLQRQMQNSVAPSNPKSTDTITAGVFQAIDIDRRRFQRKFILGTSAISAAVLTTLIGTFSSDSSLRLQVAHVDNPTKTASKVTMLAVAINKPAINIPKTASGDSFNP